MKLYALMAILIISIMTVSGMIAFNRVSSQPNYNGITVGLNVKAYHSGSSQPFAERNLPNDLPLDNFNNMMLAFFGQSQLLSGCISSWKNTGASTLTNIALTGNNNGVTCNTGTFYISNNPQSSPDCLGIGAPYCGGRFEIGTSSASATRSDYKVTSQYGSDTAISTTTCSTGSTDSAVFSGTIAITSTATIQEAAGGIGIPTLTTPSGFTTNFNGGIMFFHDTFSGISVVNGDSVTIQYTINLNNVGFNVNLCNVLAAMFTGTINKNTYTSNTGVAVTLTKTGGGTNAFYVWCNGGGIGQIILTQSSCGNPWASNNAYIAIGTGSSAFTPTSTQLNTQLATTPITTYQYVSGNGEMYWSVTFNLGSSNTIREAGLFHTLSGNNYMFAANTFTGQAQTANQAWGITLQVSD